MSGGTGGFGRFSSHPIATSVNDGIARLKLQGSAFCICFALILSRKLAGIFSPYIRLEDIPSEVIMLLLLPAWCHPSGGRLYWLVGDPGECHTEPHASVAAVAGHSQR